MTEELNPNTQDDSIDAVLAYARALPDFPNKALVLQRLETGNLNRYQEALLNLNEQIANLENAANASDAGAAQPPTGDATAQQLQALVSRIAKLEAQDPIAE